MDDPSLSEHIEGLIGLLLGGRLHKEIGRLQEGIVFGGGMIVDEDDGSEPTLPSLIVRFLDGRLSHRSRLIGKPTVDEQIFIISQIVIRCTKKFSYTQAGDKANDVQAKLYVSYTCIRTTTIA